MIRRDHSTPLGFHPKGKKRSSTDGLTAALEEMRQRQIDASQTDCGLLAQRQALGPAGRRESGARRPRWRPPFLKSEAEAELDESGDAGE
ncbi:MAG: hypothetical protein ACK6D7_02075, partial [Acidobacteriota bacterium]